MSDLLKLAEYLSAFTFDSPDTRKYGLYVGRISLGGIKAIIKAALSEVERDNEMASVEREAWRDIFRKAILEIEH